MNQILEIQKQINIEIRSFIFSSLAWYQKNILLSNNPNAGIMYRDKSTNSIVKCLVRFSNDYETNNLMCTYMKVDGSIITIDSKKFSELFEFIN